MENEPMKNFNIPFANSSDDIEAIETENSCILHNYKEDIEFDPDENLMDIDTHDSGKKTSIQAKDWEKVIIII